MTAAPESPSPAAEQAAAHHAAQLHASRKRSLAKTISWRAVGSIDTFIITYLVTGQAKFGAFVASAEVITKIALYYLHERGWAHIRWGLQPVDDDK